LNMQIAPLLTVRQFMTTNPLTVNVHQTVQEVVRVMSEGRVGAVPVLKDGELVGIFTERDLLRHTAIAPMGWRQQCVSAWMSTKPWTIGPDANWEQARSLMETLHIRHVPVVEKGKVIGLIATRDLLDQSNVYLTHQVEERTRELREAYERLQQRDDELRSHMNVAGRIQSRLLPGKGLDVPEFHCATMYLPVDALGGDYYNFVTQDRYVGVLIADATGHSIPAAMVTIMAHTAFHASTRDLSNAATVLQSMNRHLHGLTGDHFLTAWFGVLDRQNRTLQFANAGHPQPLLCRPNRTCEPLQARGLILGILPEVEYDNNTIQLQVGDRLVLYTDGVIESMRPDHAQFGIQRLRECILDCQGQSGITLTQRIADQLIEFRGRSPITDDVTVLALDLLD
jgi:serine phosphatase RsbU (regulator of sigma subunit)